MYSTFIITIIYTFRVNTNIPVSLNRYAMPIDSGCVSSPLPTL